MNGRQYHMTNHNNMTHSSVKIKLFNTEMTTEVNENLAPGFGQT